MRGFHIDDRVEMILREVERLRVAGAEVNAERAVRFAVVLDGVLVLVNGCVGLGFVIAFDERRAATVTATHFKHILVREIIAAGNVMIELDRGAVDLVLRFKFHSLAFGRHEAVIQKRDRGIADAPREILIPMFPEELFEGGHESP